MDVEEGAEDEKTFFKGVGWVYALLLGVSGIAIDKGGTRALALESTNSMKEIEMKLEEEVKKEELNPIEESLSDLSVTDDQADEAKGGIQAAVKIYRCPSDPS